MPQTPLPFSSTMTVLPAKAVVQPSVYVILLNYQKPELTQECIQSLTKLNYPNLHVVVVDNASGDHSAQLLSIDDHPEFQSYCFIQSPSNGGYSSGNNQGIYHALEKGAEFVWLLNNDTTVMSDTLEPLLKKAEQGGGLAASVQIKPESRDFLYGGGKVLWGQGKTRGLSREEVFSGVEPDYLSAASLLIPRWAFYRTGLLDEGYFLYVEDLEFTIRASREGIPLILVPESRVCHLKGASSGGSQNPRNIYYAYRNRLILFSKYANPLQKVAIAWHTGLHGLHLASKSIVHKPDRLAYYRTRLKCFVLALRDFMNGVRGSCPHPL
jgi:GT2 family glycosyltransferase